MIGFETIGNATITVFDEKPVLVTDPWIEGNPYFGSWAHKYQIPAQQLENIKNAKYVWVSHGHPDHIDPDSLNIFKDKTFLIASHYGDRIYNDLKKNYKVIKLKNNSWFELSKNIRVKTFADWNQDSCLLIEINKDQIILNLNDGQALGWSTTIKNIIKDYKHKFLLALVSWGDADMINFYNNNHFIQPHAALQKPCGETYSYLMKKWGCNYAIPFSSMHKYIREDSIKMNKFINLLIEKRIFKLESNQINHLIKIDLVVFNDNNNVRKNKKFDFYKLKTDTEADKALVPQPSKKKETSLVFFRSDYVQCSIVKICKLHKEQFIKEDDLFTKVNNGVKMRFDLDKPLFAKSLEKLVDQDYVEKKEISDNSFEYKYIP